MHFVSFYHFRYFVTGPGEVLRFLDEYDAIALVACVVAVIGSAIVSAVTVGAIGSIIIVVIATIIIKEAIAGLSVTTEGIGVRSTIIIKDRR